MENRNMVRGALIAGIMLFTLTASAATMVPTPAQRGEQALTQRAFMPPPWSVQAYSQAWRRWPGKPKESPQPYDQAFMEHYGLHRASYPNGRYPMGVRETTFLGS